MWSGCSQLLKYARPLLRQRLEKSKNKLDGERGASWWRPQFADKDSYKSIENVK